MRHNPALLFLVAAVGLGVCTAREALADDTFVVTLRPGLDAGTLANNAALPVSGGQLMVRCDNYDAKLKFCNYAVTCAATANDTTIDADKSTDLCPNSDRKQVSLFRTYDGGVPTCRFYTVNPKTVCPP